ncbi:MAG: DUF1367 family protein [Acidobacteriaceae bacterium]
MPIEVLLVREGTKLAAADSLSAETIAEIKPRETVTATIRRPRNPKHHRKLWALLSVVFENQTGFATKDDLLGAIKIATGLFDTGMTIDRIPYVIPKSISFTAMDQARFEQWYEKAIDVILTKILPLMNRNDLEIQIHQILDGYG